jgi:hypothetical protein
LAGQNVHGLAGHEDIDGYKVAIDGAAADRSVSRIEGMV